MRQKRIWTVALVLALVLALPPASAQATPPIGGNTISFGASNDVGASADSVHSVAVGDLDNDGDLDIVSGSGTGEDNEVIAWQNDGSPFSGTWTQNDVGTHGDSVALSVAVGDLDNDGDLDIVSAMGNIVDIWENDGSPFSGTWTMWQVGSAGSSVYEVAVGDLDNDGDLDIVSGSDSSEDYEVIAWQSDGTPFNGGWSQNDVGGSADSVYSVAVGDLDNDGDLDIVSGSGTGEDNEVIAWQNDGSPFSGTWTPNDVGASTARVNSVAVGDLDNDGYPDIISGSNWEEDYEAIAWQNDGSPFSGLWTQNDVSNPGDSVRSVAVGDLDSDGDLDIVAVGDNGMYTSGWQNDGTPFSGTWTQTEVMWYTTYSVQSVAVGDLDNDGDLDVVSGNESGEDYEVIVSQNTLVHRNMPFDPAGNDVGASEDTVPSVAVGDLDNDGDLDIVAGSESGGTYEVIAWRNDGTPFGTWTRNDVGVSTDSVRSVALGDLDNDGDLDIVSGSDSGEDNEVIAWQNDGSPFSGTWTPNDVGASTASVNSVAVGDLDNDGDLDIVSGSASGEDNEVIVWQNDSTPFSGTWTPNDVGASAATVRSVAVGDLDNDGDLDIVSGSSWEENREVIAWQNDGSPFSGLWTQNDVGASDTVYAVTVGDLDNDGSLDIVSGSATGEDYEVIAWQNDGTPFSDLWTQNDVGASAGAVYSVAVGDLDLDGDLDVVSGSAAGEDYEVIAWQSDGSPFSGLWTQDDVGASAASVWSVALGDLDLDGDLDIVSGSHQLEDYEVITWRNIGGSAGEATTATAPAGMGDGQTDDLLRVVATHNGLASDNDLELHQWNLLFEETSGDPLTSSEANHLIENLYVYYSVDATWEATDTVVVTIASFSLSSGVQTIAFTDGDSNVHLPATGSKTYFVVIEKTSDASSQTPNSFQITFDSDADSVVEDRAEDSSVSIQDTQPITAAITISSTGPVYLPIILKNASP